MRNELEEKTACARVCVCFLARRTFLTPHTTHTITIRNIAHRTRTEHSDQKKQHNKYKNTKQKEEQQSSTDLKYKTKNKKRAHTENM